MNSLLRFARLVDGLNARIGAVLIWLILAAVVISAGNAIVRKALDVSSNALLEAQWYLFSAVFMLGAGYVLLRNAHVRIDFISGRLSARARNVIDIVGILVFLFPLCYLMAVLAWPLFVGAWVSGEMSSNAGGLIRWPLYLLVPLGFALLALQGAAELVKRVAFLTGAGPDVLGHHQVAAHQETEEHAAPANKEAR
ncbi:MAG: TRAP transporter small permease subunit [Sulfuritalea sp.]|nr:TRAP transporter small permease subunit [Sulfuritalea sp.]